MVLFPKRHRGGLSQHNRLEESDVPEPGDGQVLCRTLVVTIAAGSRAGLQGSASYAAAPKTGIVMSVLNYHMNRGHTLERNGIRYERIRQTAENESAADPRDDGEPPQVPAHQRER